MNLLSRLIFEQDISAEYPIILSKYELIVSNNPNLDLNDMESNIQDERFLKKHLLYSKDLSDSLIRTFEIIKKENLKFNDLVFKMREIEKKLQLKIFKFAAKKSLAINNLYPKIYSLEEKAIEISGHISTIRRIFVRNQKALVGINDRLKRSMKQKRALVLYVELLKKRMINNFLMPVQEIQDIKYLSILHKSVKTIHQNEYLLVSDLYFHKKQMIKERLFFYWCSLTLDFNDKKFSNLVGFLKDILKANFFGNLNTHLYNFYQFFIKLLIVKNIRKSLFDENFVCVNTSQLYLLNDFFKLEILLPMMNSNNLCTFLVDTLKEFKQFCDSINSQILKLYEYDSLKAKAFNQSLLKEYFINKISVSKYMCNILASIFNAINVGELGELGAQAFMKIFLNYESFCFVLKKFTCHYPIIPNRIVQQLVNSYFISLKERAIRTMFYELMDENWDSICFSPEIFDEKVTRYLRSQEVSLRYSKMTDDEIMNLQKHVLQHVCSTSVKSNKFFNTEVLPISGSVPNSSPSTKAMKKDKILCRSAITIMTLFADYALLNGLFSEYKDHILEDCSFILNTWLFSVLVKFIPKNWLNILINFQKQTYPDEFEHIRTVENFHDFFVFKYTYRDLRKIFYNFNYQFYSGKDAYKLYFKSFIQNISQNNAICFKSLRQLLTALKSIEYVFMVFEHFDDNKVYGYDAKLYENIERFMLQYYFLEKHKPHPVFEKVLNFTWSTLNDVMSINKNPYLNQFISIIIDTNEEFLSLNNEGFDISRDEVMSYLYIVVDMLVTVLVEIYSQVRNCGSIGRFQMKHDLCEIMMAMDGMLTKSHITKLKEKYINFIDIYFVNTPKDVYKYIMQNFYELSFNVTKSLLITNKKTDGKTSNKNKIVMSEEQIRILEYAAKKVYKKIKDECAEEDYLEDNILVDSLENVETINDDKLKLLFNFLRIE